MAPATIAATRMGSPGGTSGTTSTVASAQTAATAPASRDRSRGQSSPRNAATAAPSRPHCFGSPMLSPASAPTSVNAFHSRKIPSPATQKPRLCSIGSVCPVLVASDSSIVTCAAAKRRQPRGCISAFNCMP